MTAFVGGHFFIVSWLCFVVYRSFTLFVLQLYKAANTHKIFLFCLFQILHIAVNSISVLSDGQICPYNNLL